jgi:hypothetical protein
MPPDIATDPTPDNQKVDALTVFTARAQARARLFADGAITLTEALSLACTAADDGLMSCDEARAILRVAFRLQKRRTPWL